MIENYPFINSVYERVKNYFPEYTVELLQHTKKLKKIVFNQKDVVALIDAEILERQLALLGESGIFKTAEVWIDQINNLVIKYKKAETGYYNSKKPPASFNRKYVDGMYVHVHTKKPTEVQIRFAIENTTTVKDAAAYLKLSKDTFLKYAREMCPDALATIRSKSRKYVIKDPIYNNSPLSELLSGKYVMLDLDKLKRRLLKECVLEERCYNCGYSLVREENGQSPLVISFRDSTLDRTKLFQIDNLYLLCYSCKYVVDGKKILKLQNKITFEQAVKNKIEELPVDAERMARFKKILGKYTDIIEEKKKDFAKQAAISMTPREIDNKQKPSVDTSMSELDSMFESLWESNNKDDSV